MVDSFLLLLAEEPSEAGTHLLTLFMTVVLFIILALLAIAVTVSRWVRGMTRPSPGELERIRKGNRSYDDDWWRKPIVPEYDPAREVTGHTGEEGESPGQGEPPAKEDG